MCSFFSLLSCYCINFTWLQSLFHWICVTVMGKEDLEDLKSTLYLTYVESKMFSAFSIFKIQLLVEPFLLSCSLLKLNWNPRAETSLTNWWTDKKIFLLSSVPFQCSAYFASSWKTFFSIDLYVGNLNLSGITWWKVTRKELEICKDWNWVPILAIKYWQKHQK